MVRCVYTVTFATINSLVHIRTYKAGPQPRLQTTQALHTPLHTIISEGLLERSWSRGRGGGRSRSLATPLPGRGGWRGQAGLGDTPCQHAAGEGLVEDLHTWDRGEQFNSREAVGGSTIVKGTGYK